MPISAFLQKLELGASLFSQQDDWFVGNKQPLHAFPICSGPTSKKQKSEHAHTYTHQIGSAEGVPCGVIYKGCLEDIAVRSSLCQASKTINLYKFVYVLW